MKKLACTIAIATLLQGCGMQVDEEKIKKMPGYDVANSFCSQCHKMPYGVQHVAVAWPSIIKRMEGHMVKAKKRLPTPQERTTLVEFFQKTAAK